jgi:hypothetical protein
MEPQTFLKKKEVGGLTFPETYYKSAIIKIVQ